MFLEVSAELLSQGYSVRFRPGGHSMSPTIRDGEAVTVEPIEAGRVRVHDIILYRAARGVIAHRVVRIERSEETGTLFHLRGDGATTPDAPVLADQILGRVVRVEREGRAIALQGRKAGLSRLACRWLASFRKFARLIAHLRHPSRI
jgi:signal peptidase I